MLLTLGMERSESASRSSVLMRMMLRDAASAGCGGYNAAESRGPRSKSAMTVIKIEERRVTLQIHSSVAPSDAPAALTSRRSMVYGV
jgi:hypothetical protein